MKAFAATLAIASLSRFAMALLINTPSGVVQCQPQLLSWSDGAPPYYLNILPGGQPSAPPLKSFPLQNALSMTWTVDLAPQAITISIKDATGAIQYTDIVRIQPGSDTSCTNADAPQAAAVAPPSGSTQMGANTGAISGTGSRPAASAAATSGPARTNAAAASTTAAPAAPASTSRAGTAVSGAKTQLSPSGALGFLGTLALAVGILL